MNRGHVRVAQVLSVEPAVDHVAANVDLCAFRRAEQNAIHVPRDVEAHRIRIVQVQRSRGMIGNAEIAEAPVLRLAAVRENEFRESAGLGAGERAAIRGGDCELAERRRKQDDVVAKRHAARARGNFQPARIDWRQALLERVVVTRQCRAA